MSRLTRPVDLDGGVRELTAPTAVVAGTANRSAPPAQARVSAAALSRCAGSTELPGWAI